MRATSDGPRGAREGGARSLAQTRNGRTSPSSRSSSSWSPAASATSAGARTARRGFATASSRCARSRPPLGPVELRRPKLRHAHSALCDQRFSATVSRKNARDPRHLSLGAGAFGPGSRGDARRGLRHGGAQPGPCSAPGGSTPVASPSSSALPRGRPSPRTAGSRSSPSSASVGCPRRCSSSPRAARACAR